MTERVLVKIRKMTPGSPTPVYKTTGSAGCDIAAAETVVIPPKESASVGTGIYLEVPVGHECQVRPRSGLALKYGVTVLNSPGTIDSDYRGQVSVLLYNSSNVPFEVRLGERIAQLVFAPVSQVEFQDVDELSKTERGANGWGSTG